MPLSYSELELLHDLLEQVVEFDQLVIYEKEDILLVSKVKFNTEERTIELDVC